MKHFNYLWYILRHKWFVFIAGLRRGVSLWQLIIHDWSKFTPSEWSGYANWFYGDVNDGNRDYLGHLFDTAWNYHQKRNPHHWQFWILINDSDPITILPMPDKYRREMLADWDSAGRCITDAWETKEWYLKNRKKIKLHPDTRKWIEGELGIGSVD